MEAFQVSEASMVSMFRRAADAIVNESTLKSEVVQLKSTAQYQDRRLEQLEGDKQSLNDYVQELQRQLSEAKLDVTRLIVERDESNREVDKLKEDNETLTTLLNETEQARDAVTDDRDFWLKSHDTMKAKHDEAKAKLNAITSALGIKSETNPSTTSGEEPITDTSEAASEVAAPATFQVHSEDTSSEKPWRDGDSLAPPTEASPVPQQQGDPIPTNPEEPSHKASNWPDWMALSNV